MPTITHSLIGGMMAFVLFLQSRYSRSERRFGKAHVIIFTINSFIGPDLGKISMIAADRMVLVNDAIHNIVGWILISFPLALLYFYIFNKFNSPKKRQPPISLSNVLRLIIAAGIFHFSLDCLDQTTRIFPNFDIFPDWGISVAILSLNGITYEGLLPEVAAGFGFTELFMISIVFLVIIICFFYKKSLKSTMIVAGVYVLVILGLLITLGTDIVHDENDLGFLIYGAFFWILPLALCVWSYQEPSEDKHLESAIR